MRRRRSVVRDARGRWAPVTRRDVGWTRGSVDTPRARARSRRGRGDRTRRSRRRSRSQARPASRSTRPAGRAPRRRSATCSATGVLGPPRARTTASRFPSSTRVLRARGTCGAMRATASWRPKARQGAAGEREDHRRMRQGRGLATTRPETHAVRCGARRRRVRGRGGGRIFGRRCSDFTVSFDDDEHRAARQLVRPDLTRARVSSNDGVDTHVPRMPHTRGAGRARFGSPAAQMEGAANGGRGRGHAEACPERCACASRAFVPHLAAPRRPALVRGVPINRGVVLGTVTSLHWPQRWWTTTVLQSGRTMLVLSPHGELRRENLDSSMGARRDLQRGDSL